MACVGHACEHAVLISPSLILRDSFFALSFTSCMRCTHMEHFSITPRARTTTSGFKTILPNSVCDGFTSANLELVSYSNQLKRLTLYGQLFAQYLVPIQRLYAIWFNPSEL